MITDVWLSTCAHRTMIRHDPKTHNHVQKKMAAPVCILWLETNIVIIPCWLAANVSYRKSHDSTRRIVSRCHPGSSSWNFQALGRKEKRDVWYDLLNDSMILFLNNQSVNQIAECVARRVPVSLWGSGGWGCQCVCQTSRNGNHPQPFAAVRKCLREGPMAVPLGEAANRWSLLLTFQTCGSFVSCGRPMRLHDITACTIMSRSRFAWQALLNTKGFAVKCQADMKLADLRFDTCFLECLLKRWRCYLSRWILKVTLTQTWNRRPLMELFNRRRWANPAECCSCRFWLLLAGTCS